MLIKQICNYNHKSDFYSSTIAIMLKLWYYFLVKTKDLLSK